MILLGQHGQRQDYHMGLDYIAVAAQTCDQNAPQGAYVRLSSCFPSLGFKSGSEPNIASQVYGMLLAGELPQVNVPEAYLPLDINFARVNIEKAAYHGFAKAQVKMGSAYELCQLGCDFSPALSLHYNALAAHQGEPEAEMAISKWFLCGHEGIFEKNDELAFTFAQRAAQSNLPTAEFALGYFYEVGIFVPVDIKEARSWYAKAATAGNKDASGRIESISRSKTLTKKDHEKVAIARIKSRYGSQARRPLGPTPERLEMPDPSKMSLSDGPSPSSASPYYNRADSRPRPNHPGYPADPRPGSAFGFNPNIRPNAAGYARSPQPPPAHRAASYGPGPMSYPQQGPPTPSSGQPVTSPGALSGPPKLDIGYAAPLDAPNSRHNGMPDRMAARTPHSAHPRSGASPSFPPRAESVPPPKESASSTPRPSKSPATSSKTAPTASQPTKQGAPASKPAASLPGKGPKTFDEMGVPATKASNDCVCYSFLVTL